MNERTRMPHGDPNVNEWLVDQIALYVGGSPGRIPPESTLAELGLGSVQMLAMCGDAEDAFNITVDPSVVFDNPTVAELSAALQILVNSSEHR